MKQNANIYNAIVNHHYQVHRRVSQLPAEEEEEAGLKVSPLPVLMTVMRIVVVVVVMMVVIVTRLPHHNVSITPRQY